MYYIIGLGNPEEKYDGTRHNIGRDLLKMLADASAWDKNKHANALSTRIQLSGEVVELFLPETYMNKSGETVRHIHDKQQARPEDFIVVYDDVDVPLGEVKISVRKGDGGHNGIKSIIDALKSKDFVRVRVGVAGKSFWTGKMVRPHGGIAMNRHVLGKFSRGERKTVEDVSGLVTKILETIVRDGVEKAMNQYN